MKTNANPEAKEAIMTKFVWTRRAVDRWAAGKADPSHTISAPNIGEVYMGFVSQLRPGTPWILVNGSEVIAASDSGW